MRACRCKSGSTQVRRELGNLTLRAVTSSSSPCFLESSLRSSFPGYFRPKAEEFDTLWRSALIAVDANVLLNLYRYSQQAREALLGALNSVRGRLFVPHQAAREFLDNRLGVTASQADEYTKTIRVITDLVQNLSNTKRHPFLPESELPEFRVHAERVCTLLDNQREQLHHRLTEDETLDALDQICSEAMGAPFTIEELKSIESEGILRYQNKIPPGYRDAKKEGVTEVHKKFGDLILWKQVIRRAKEAERPLILVTDDQKDDWWSEQSGRTVGPRPELVEEFSKEARQRFWMYSVDQFLEHLSTSTSVKVSRDVLEEVIEQRERTKEEAHASDELADEMDLMRRISRDPEYARVTRSSPSYARELLRRYVGIDSLSDAEIVARVASESRTPVTWVSRQLDAVYGRPPTATGMQHRDPRSSARIRQSMPSSEPQTLASGSAKPEDDAHSPSKKT
jgi:hypothetical protein